VTIFGFKNTGPVRGHDDLYNKTCTGRRWALSVSRWRVELEHQWQHNHGKWVYAAGYYGVGVRASLGLGHSMMYYDGEHHSFDLGPFYITWWR
jgi:hypothetical protein